MQNKTVPLQRVIGPLSAIPARLRQLGVEPSEVFSGLQIAEADLVPGNLVPYSEVVALLARAAEATGRQTFGLELGEGHDHLALGVLGQLMANAPTLGAALQDYVSMQMALSRAAASYLYRAGDTYVFGYGTYERNTPGSWQVYDVTIVVALNIVTSLSRGAIAPDEVLICHRPPVDRRPYERLLRCVPQFDQSQNCLVLSASSMRYPIPGADPAARKQLLAKSNINSGFVGDELTPRVRHLIRAAICTGDVSMKAIAASLQLNPKTLERHLASESTSFEQIKEDVRYVVARDLLELTDMPIGEVALAVSFAAHSTFDRAFVRWSGVTPSEWRSRLANVG